MSFELLGTNATGLEILNIIKTKAVWSGLDILKKFLPHRQILSACLWFNPMGLRKVRPCRHSHRTPRSPAIREDFALAAKF